MDPSTVNVLLSTFPGLGLPHTLCVPFSGASTVEDVHAFIVSKLPPAISYDRLVLSTNNAQRLPRHSNTLLASLASKDGQTSLLPLRLHVPCLGGKGGFGSQLRAQGGRMASRKKRDGPVVNSNRNLEGRRMRTVDEAKALAEYLSAKPEIERREKEERIRKLQGIIHDCQQKRERNNGLLDMDDGEDDADWERKKEEADRKIQESIRNFAKKSSAAQTPGDDSNEPQESRVNDRAAGSSGESKEGSEESDESDEAIVNTASPFYKKPPPQKPVKVWGWDEDDSSSSSDEDDAEPATTTG